MTTKPRDNNPHGGQSGKPTEHHGSSPVELAAINETLIAFAKKYDENNEKHPGRDWWKFILEIVAVVGVGVYTAITGGILIAALYQLSDSNTQIGIMKDGEQRQLRAYVGPSPGDVEDFGVDDKERVKMIRKNYGLTPAYEVGFTTLGTLIVKPAGSPFDINTGGCGTPKVVNLATMFPSVELPLTLRTVGPAVKPDDVALVRDEKAQFVYFGSVCYRDAFGITHYTNYCFMYKGLSMTAKDADVCLTHNDSN
jgi:hypothetical protein